MKGKCIWVWLMAFLFLGGLMGLAQARVSGQCSNCHTMHNSQGGNPMTFNNSTQPNQMLLRGDCVGCHAQAKAAGSNPASAAPDGIPQVYLIDQGVENSSTLYKFDDLANRKVPAAGDFWWVTQGDQYGHNVAGLTNPDGTLNEPPGFVQNYGNNGIPSAWSGQVSCAGTYGCHGKHDTTDQFAAISGAHHADDSTIDGTSVGTSYRFLYGILGAEDSDWELTVSSGDHNGYYAVALTNRGSENNTGTTPDEKSINYLCAECHGKFHDYVLNTAGAYSASNPWVRHPVDFALSAAQTSSDNYTKYPNPTLFTSVSQVGEYFPDVPLGSNNPSTNSTTVSFDGQNDIVLCLSCHKAHASPWPDALRWNYAACTAGSPNGDCGCFACHTNK